MSNSDRKRRTPEQIWKALEEMADNDERDRIKALSDDALDAELREGGFDPAKVRADGAAFAKQLLEQRQHEKNAAKGLASTRARLAERASRRGTLSRDELVKRIQAVESDSRVAGKIAVGFRNRDTAPATVGELEDLLDEMEELLDAALRGEKPS